MQDNSGRPIRREIKGGQLGKKLGKKLGEKVGEKPGEKVEESLGKIHKLNLCHFQRNPKILKKSKKQIKKKSKNCLKNPKIQKKSKKK